MPYERLPTRLRQLIPSEKGQEIFRNVFNSQLKAGRSESVAFASAWGALDRAGYKKGPDGKYEKVTEKSRDSTLQDKVDEYNEKYGTKHGRVSLGMLKNVYDRGIGAYCTNPSSVRPNVNSKEQWTFARVNSFLAVARGAKKINHDKDIHDKIKKSQPSASAVHVPSTDWEKSETYRPPAGARAAARRAIRWKEKYGDKIRGGTQVGWTRAGQLARGENLSRETVARMASFFARHRGNEKVDPRFKDEPWRDAGHVAWQIWGSDAADTWSRQIMDNLKKRKIDDDQFTTPAEATVRSMDLGLEGEIHVHERDGNAVYMPGENHEEYLERINEMAGIESSDLEPVKQGLLDRTISAIIGTVMQQVYVNKSVVETQVLKMDDEQRIVYGWASVVTEDGEPVVDTQGDVITPEEMEKMANDFMLDVRKAKAMHTGGQVGEVIHSIPLTNELMKAFDIYSDREGWLVAFKIYDDDAWEKVRSGEFQALSIGGKAGSREKVE